MPASFQYVPSISITSNPNGAGTPGVFYNAYIKSLNVDIGLADNPTSIQVGLINENGNYPDFSKMGNMAGGKLTYLDPYHIYIGNDLKFVAYLIGQRRVTSVDSKTTELEFVDGSHILDRTFIGGIGIHSMNPRWFANAWTYNTLPVECAPCYQDQIINVPQKDTTFVNVTSPPYPPIYTHRLLKNSLLQGIGDNQNGGYIYLGNEKFTRTSCDLAEVDYSFTELIQACANRNIIINIPDISIFNGKSTLRNSYWGTLRKVLQDWCADFGMSFTYDYRNLVPTINPVYLGNNVLSGNIDLIASTAKLIKSSSSALVESIDENKNLKGSYIQNTITTYRRPRVKREFDKTTFYGTAYKAFQPSDILTSEAMSFREEGNFMQCCSMAKYNESIRSLYIMLTAAVNNDPRIFRCLGFNFAGRLDADVKKEIIDECLDTDTYRDITSKWVSPSSGDFEMYLGTYSEEISTKHLEFEKGIANDFLGKWYYTNLNSYSDEKYGGFQRCFTGTDWRYEVFSSITPEPIDIPTSTIGMQNSNIQTRMFNQSRLPFHKNLYGPIPINPWTNYSWFNDSRIKIYNRTEAPWGTNEEYADSVFNQKTDKGVQDLVEPFLPRFQEIKGMIETRLRARYKGTNIPVGSVIDGIKEKTIPCIMIFPSPARIAEILQVSPWIPTVNWNETPYYDNKGTAQVNKVDCAESTVCEIQENLEKIVCDPANLCADYPQLPPASVNTSFIGKIYAARDGQPFPEGVLSKLSGGTRIVFRPPLDSKTYIGPPRILDIVAPAGSFEAMNDLFLANYKEQVKSAHYTPRAEISLGDPANPPYNVSEVRVNINDVSSNDPVFSAVDPATGQVKVITKIYIHGMGFLELSQYHQFVSSMNNGGNAGDPLKHDLSVGVGGIDFGPLKAYLKSEFGLNKLSISIGPEGASSTAGWSNRESQSPSPNLFQKEVEPQLIAKGYF